MRTPASLGLMLAILAAGCLGASDVKDASMPTQDPQRPAPTFKTPVNVSTERAGAEPMLAVAPDGTLYVIGTGWRPREPIPLNAPSNAVWRSTDDGDTWTDVTPPLPTADSTGLDNAIAVGADGTTYYTNAAASTLAMFRTADAGASWEPLAVPPLPTPMHRTWLATSGDARVHLVVEGLDTHNWYTRSDDHGTTWTPPTPIHPTVGFGSDLAVAPDTGHLYLARLQFADSPLGVQGWHLWRSTDEGTTWQDLFMFDLQGTLTGSWQSLEAAPDGRLHMVWAEARGGNSLIRHAYSTDDGETWSEPRVLVERENAQTLPWLAARAPSELGIVWYEADQPGHPGKIDAAWRVHYAFVDRADTDAPDVRTALVTPWAVHQGPICPDGPACPNSERELLDFAWIAFGPDGLARLAWASTMWDGPSAYAAYAGESDGRS